MITPENVIRHELIGLECKVVSAKNKTQSGIKGKIIDETRKILSIETAKGLKHVPKQGSVIRLNLRECGKVVEIQCDQLIAKPEDRIKKKFDEW